MLLRKFAGGWVDSAQHLTGFGGFHGGLALAILASAARSEVSGLELQSISGRFDRLIESGFHVKPSLVRSGRSSAVVTVTAESPKGVHINASGVFGVPTESSWPVVQTPAPVAPPPEQCDVFVVPKEFVPISTSMEIRPVGSARPYAGGPDPELTAWVRLLEDDDPPDPLRFVFLMDALAPSYSAMLSDLVLVPTIELTVRPGPGLSQVTSPWILLRARTRAASAGGWVDEQIDAWDQNGIQLGTAHQLRIVRES